VGFVVDISEAFAASILGPFWAGTSHLNQRTRIAEAGLKQVQSPVCRPLLI